MYAYNDIDKNEKEYDLASVSHEKKESWDDVRESCCILLFPSGKGWEIIYYEKIIWIIICKWYE